MLSDPTRINDIKSKEGACEAEHLRVLHNGRRPPNSDLKLNGMCAYYNIRTDPSLGLGFAAFCRVVCGYKACKEQCIQDMPQMRSVCCGGDMRG
jgi:ribulose kinase